MTRPINHSHPILIRRCVHRHDAARICCTPVAQRSKLRWERPRIDSTGSKGHVHIHMRVATNSALEWVGAPLSGERE